MNFLYLLGTIILFWILAHQTLGRLIFRNRQKHWEVMEDMMNEGVQTSLLMLLSGVLAVAAGLVTAMMAAWV